MPSARQRIGQEAEDKAARFLLGQGYEIIDRHVTSRYGEIDILARDGEVIVAIEVKSRNSDAHGRAVEAVTDRKLEKIAAALHEVLVKREWQLRPYRIDVITIDPDRLNYIRGVGLSV